MALPPHVTVTPLARRVFAFCESEEEAERDPTLKQIMSETRCSKDRAVYWRKIWRQHREDLSEAPPPTVRHRVDAVDPLSVFPPAPPPAPSTPAGPSEPHSADRDDAPAPAPTAQPTKSRSRRILL